MLAYKNSKIAYIIIILTDICKLKQPRSEKTRAISINVCHFLAYELALMMAFRVLDFKIIQRYLC